MKNSTTMHDFFKRKNSNSSKVNMKLPTTNVTIPILKNVDIPILENMHFPILENVNSPISQTQFEILDAYLNFFFFFLSSAAQLEILGPSLLTTIHYHHLKQPKQHQHCSILMEAASVFSLSCWNGGVKVKFSWIHFLVVLVMV